MNESTDTLWLMDKCSASVDVAVPVLDRADTLDTRHSDPLAITAHKGWQVGVLFLTLHSAAQQAWQAARPAFHW